MRNPGAVNTGASAKNRQNHDKPQFTRPAPRLQRLAEHLHQLGPRAVHEFVLEIADKFGPEVVERLEVYRRLDPDTVRKFGGDRFPPRLFAVGDRR